MLTLLTRNQATQSRHEMLNGVDFLVVPGVPAREKVMNGYLVPGDELSHFYEAWNGVPIVLDHPKQNDGSATVPVPDVPVIGRFYNAQWDEGAKRLTGEYWIDVKTAGQTQKGKNVLDALEHNQMLETSTGYWADEMPQMGSYNGVQYKTIHRNLRPNHIAILPDTEGACSLVDGCGLNRNDRTFTNCDACPHKNQGPMMDMPSYRPGHLPRVMLEPYSVNKGARTPEQIAALRDHMGRAGIDKPVQIMRMDTGALNIRDGNHRVSMAREFNIDQIPVNVVDEKLQPIDPQTVYAEWAHKQDQGYLNMKLKFNALSKARTPSYSGAESTSWEGVTKTLSAFASAWMKQGGKMPEGGMPSKMGDMPAACLNWIASKTLLGDPKADNPGDLMMFPVVNPNTNKLNAGALRAVLSGRGAQADIPAPALESARSVARRLLDQEFKSTKGNAKMKLEDLLKKLEEQGVKIKVNAAAEGDETAEPSYELESVTPPAATPAPDDDEVEEDEEPKADPLFTQDEVAGLKTLAKAAPALLKDLPAVIAMAQNAAAREQSEKAALVAKIKANQSNVYSDGELGSMALPILTKLDAQMSVNYAGLGVGTFDNSAQADEFVLPPAVLLAAPVKEE